MRLVPEGFFTGDTQLTTGDKASAVVTIATALGIAWVVDMQRKHAFDHII